MATDPIDFDSFFAELGPNLSQVTLADVSAPDGTKLGHMHLRVGDIPTAERFYHGVLGFDIVAKMPSALFVSAGGYHHHIGMNVWESRRGGPATEPSAGLRMFSIVLPDESERERLIGQITTAGVAVERTAAEPVVRDPWQNAISLILRDSA